jgi:hypothetical protein
MLTCLIAQVSIQIPALALRFNMPRTARMRQNASLTIPHNPLVLADEVIE